jgi:hypothetical protein
MFSEKFGWQPIDAALMDKDVMLFVSDGRGEPYAVYKPFKLTAAGWVSSGRRRLFPVRARVCACQARPRTTRTTTLGVESNGLEALAFRIGGDRTRFGKGQAAVIGARKKTCPLKALSLKIV